MGFRMSELVVDPSASIGARLRPRLHAAAVHLGCCVAVAAAVLALVFVGWYPSPLDSLAGVDTILLIMLGADVVLGPLVTLIVFDRAKKSLKLDLAAVAVIQLVALGYGLHTLHQGRPAHLVFVKDRFELIAPADLRADDRAAAASNPAAAADPLRPTWVAARAPDDPAERQRILVQAIEHGRDLQHHPRLYEPFERQAAQAAPSGLSFRSCADTGEVLRVIDARPW